MKTDLRMNFNNEYTLELIDSSTNKVKQHGVFHNMVLNGIHRSLNGGAYSTGTSFGSESAPQQCYGGMFYSLGVGNGTSAPERTQSGLSSPMWEARPESTTSEWIDDYTLRATATFSFPATSSYVGTITEVGLYNWYYYDYRTNGKGNLCTRALLTDSEGQPISFDKTDTDILKITVSIEMSIASALENFKVFRKPYILPHTVIATDTSLHSVLANVHGDLNLARYEADMTMDQLGSKTSDTYIRDSRDSLVCNAKLGESYIRYATRRFPATEITSETYFKAVSVPSVGYWLLPNEAVFPAYTIKDINIGTGDGTSTIFNNPLSYFKAGTDKVYKNGVQLTRGVDYSINNVGNINCLPELAPLPTRVYSDFTSYVIGLLYVPFRPSVGKVSNDSEYSRTFKSDAPLYIEYDEAVTLNCLRTTDGFAYFPGASASNSPLTSGTIYLDASDDGVTYYEVASRALSSTKAFMLDFIDTTAKYWRLRFSTGRTDEIGISTNTRVSALFLSRKDPYIVFAEAPAEGDIITMDVDMDLIMKNENFVLDIGCQVNFIA